jgi:hypothetical protein
MIADYKTEKIKRIIAAFIKIEKTDPNALTNIEKLAKMAETQPGKYFLALKFL